MAYGLRSLVSGGKRKGPGDGRLLMFSNSPFYSFDEFLEAQLRYTTESEIDYEEEFLNLASKLKAFPIWESGRDDTWIEPEEEIENVDEDVTIMEKELSQIFLQKTSEGIEYV